MKNEIQELKLNQKNIQQYEFTNKSCSKSMLNKVKNNNICLKLDNNAFINVGLSQEKDVIKLL